MVRNMATTTGLLMSEWARTPHDLIAEIRYRMAELIKPEETWSLTHPNGTGYPRCSLESSGVQCCGIKDFFNSG